MNKILILSKILDILYLEIYPVCVIEIFRIIIPKSCTNKQISKRKEFPE